MRDGLNKRRLRVAMRTLQVLALLLASAIFMARAQTDNGAVGFSEQPPVITNLHQLSILLDSTPRITTAIRLEVVVCSASRPEIGVLVAMDDSGSELLELGPRSTPFKVGERIRIEGTNCLLRRREIGVEITHAPVADNDDTHPFRTVQGEIYLPAGVHPLRLDYFNIYGRNGLEASCRLPDGQEHNVNQFLLRSADGSINASNLVGGVEVKSYEGSWMNVPDFALLEPVTAITAPGISISGKAGQELFGMRFTGFFSAPMSGMYRFNLASDDGSLLFVKDIAPSISPVARGNVPAPAAVSLPAPMANSKSRQWMSVEGRVSFVSRLGTGFQFELRSPPDAVRVMLADASGLDPARLLNARVRVTGIGRAVIAANRQPVLGLISVAKSDDVAILESSGDLKSGEMPQTVLTAVGQIQSLPIEKAAHGARVRIHGVVTSVGPTSYRFMSVQDETRGIFVRLPATIESVPTPGRFCEIIGHTAAGDFAPVVVADHVITLGRGRLPVPARPTWNELINGSMDVQWVELQGLVTGVRNNELLLLLPEGEIRVQAEDYSESRLKPFEKAVVRIRGVLYAAWNTNRTVQVGHLMMRNASINVDAPAPSDPFDAALKSSSELFQFDPRATAFQRVRVRGVAVYVEPRRFFLMEGSRGLRVFPVNVGAPRIGDELEVVGYPDISGPAPQLREAVVRRTGRTAEPQPRELTGGDLIREDLDSALVRIQGKLLGLHAEQNSRVLEMSAHGHLFLARLTDAEADLALRVGSQLAVTGVYIGKGMAGTQGQKPSGFELLLNSPSQIAVISQPSWWTPQRLLITVGLLLLVLVLAAVWISQLQRLVEQRTADLQREIREREIAERQRALEAERSRIARDLHDDLGSSLTEIGVLASKGQRLQVPDGELAVLFRTIAGKARGSVTALDGIVWAVDPEDNDLQSVADYLSDFASDYLFHSGIACRFDIPVTLPRTVLDGRLRHDLLLAVKETLNNIVRHARATEVEFRLAITGDRLDIMISDNGTGFDIDSLPEGNGLKNLPLRLSKVGGRYEVDSKPGKGTTVKIGISLAASAELQDT